MSNETKQDVSLKVYEAGKPRKGCRRQAGSSLSRYAEVVSLTEHDPMQALLGGTTAEHFRVGLASVFVSIWEQANEKHVGPTKVKRLLSAVIMASNGNL
jgi:hypothetical protein